MRSNRHRPFLPRAAKKDENNKHNSELRLKSPASNSNSSRPITDRQETDDRWTAHVIKYYTTQNLYSAESPSESEVVKEMMKESIYMDKAGTTCALVIVDNSGRSSHTCVIS